MVLVYSDNKNLTIEILSKAVELAKEQKKKVITTIIGKPDETLAKEYIAYGADIVINSETSLKDFKAEESNHDSYDVMGHLVVSMVTLKEAEGNGESGN